MPSRLLTLAVAVAQLAVLAVADPEEVCSTVYDTVSYEEVETITLPVPVTTITVTQHPSLTETDLSTITKSETAYASASVISLSTTYEHVTSTVHETITNVKTHVSPVTATVTVTTVSTSTITANSRLTQINSWAGSLFASATSPAKRKIKKRANACHPRSTTPQSQSSPTPSPQLYPKSVVCTPAEGVYSTLTSTEIAAVVTVTVTPSASVEIITSTITSTTTVVHEVVATSYFSSTDTATASSDITSYSTTTTTSTSYTSTSTFYDFCGPGNQANYQNGNRINGESFRIASGQSLTQVSGGATSAYDCCMKCMGDFSTVYCVASAFRASTGECSYIRGDTACAPNQNANGGWALTNATTGEQWTLSNGGCGHWSAPY